MAFIRGEFTGPTKKDGTPNFTHKDNKIPGMNCRPSRSWNNITY